MNTIILTSYLDFYEKDEQGNKIAHNFGNDNGILDCLKSNIKKYDNFVFVANGMEGEKAEAYFKLACNSFELTLPFNNYELQGDYYIPCLVLDEEDTQPIGMWGRKYLRYIKEHRPVLHTTLLLSGKLNSHLVEIDNRATEMFDRLVKQLAEKEGISEQLKAHDQLAWVQRMNNIRNAAEEIVNAEVIFA